MLAGGNAMDHRRCGCVVISCVALATAWFDGHAVVDPNDACAQESPRPARDDLHLEARKLVQEIVMERGDADDKWQPAKLVKEPVLRFNDPTRDDTLGGIWVWGDRGRPAAILELYLKAGGDWLLVFNNLSGGDVRAKRHG